MGTKEPDSIAGYYTSFYVELEKPHDNRGFLLRPIIAVDGAVQQGFSSSPTGLFRLDLLAGVDCIPDFLPLFRAQIGHRGLVDSCLKLLKILNFNL